MHNPFRSIFLGASPISLTAVLLVASLAQGATVPPLIPLPREARAVADLPLSGGVRVTAPGRNAADLFAASDLAGAFAERGVATGTSGGAATIELLRTSSPIAQQRLHEAGLAFDPAMAAEGYAITASGRTVTVIAASAEGIFYGAQTLKQLMTGNGPSAVLHTANVRDWPAMKYRGLSDDLSRGPFPTLAFQKKQIRTLAAYKVNIYSPYFEHTFQYTSNPLAAVPGGSLTPAEARELVAYAAPYHVLIIPEQEAFGHLHHALAFDQYAPLAETPHGHVLAPGQPGSLDLIQQWFTELAAIFPGEFLHVGADETEELGAGQTKADVTSRGLGAVYLDFLTRVHALLLPLHRRLLFWGDIAMSNPELVQALPADMKRDMIAVAWEYNPHPKRGFSRYLLPYTQAGMETWVATGVNNWNRPYSNNSMALDNIQEFVRDGQKLGSTGELNTVWNDDGEGIFDMDWYGVLFGAAAAWQPGESSIPQFEQSYGPVFHGDTTGDLDQAQLELMAAHTLIKTNTKLGDISDGLFWIDPWSKDGQTMAAQLRPYLRDLRLHAERAITLIAQARSAPTQTLRETAAIDAMELGARRIDFIGLKFELADEMAADYASAYAMQGDPNPDSRKEVSRELGDINSVNGRCEDLRDGYTLLHDLYQQAWLRDNRPYWLRNNLARYDQSTLLWLNRMDTFRGAQRQWGATHTIPTAAELGVPAPPSVP